MNNIFNDSMEIKSDIQCQTLAKSIIELDLQLRPYLKDYPQEFYEHISHMQYEKLTRSCVATNT